MDGFRRAKRRPSKSLNSGYHATPQPVMSAQGDRYYDIRAANAKTATTALARKLKGRHMQMIAFGGAIGTGLFVASGNALYKGGPANLILSFLILGAMQYCTVQSLCELCVLFPVTGSFSAFSTRFIDPSWGFAIGWNYFLLWLFVLPLEIIAGAFTVSYWNDAIPKAILVTIFLVSIFAINLCGIKVYGEAEFIFSIIKITAIVGFILLGIVINIGGPPEGGYIGGYYWQNPGPFNNGFKGLCTVLVSTAFTFGGTELVGLAAPEAVNPSKSLPKAFKQVFWRITIFYVGATLIMTLLVSSDNPRLIGSSNHSYSSASAFIIAIEKAGITILPSVMNAIVLIAIISVGNSAVFSSSRTLLALAEQSHAPQFFAYVDKQGRPLMAIICVVCVGLLGFLADFKLHQTIFNWLLATSSLGLIFTWGSICLCHIRFRIAWAYKARSLDQLPFRSHSGVIGSWFALVGYILLLASQVYIAISPIQTPILDTSTSGKVQTFFLQVMAIPILLVLYVSHKIYFHTQVVPIDKIDVETGRRSFRPHITAEREQDEKRNWPFWKRVYYRLC
ncbi:amino acid permease/ SLC12A domain-containing protein [Dactylonectria macrodidyma]|uniref:Amino acid permease/ SLC12A domain-containing protein n=1 Tax=Dactylonectria macrodidyma TaxID=307937 RepID=A0A9P9IGI3_9HYPO|nr:amino acid permease/ SLC12A domain-containing protein [Dactylonectria macrodidyma]